MPDPIKKDAFSRRLVQYLLYAAVFLTPLNATFLYIPLIAAVFVSLYRRIRFGKGEWHFGGLRLPAAGFLACSLLSVVFSVDSAFSLFNWCFLPLMYAALYVMIVSYTDTEAREKELFRVMLAAAAVTVLYGVFQFANVEHMAEDIAAQDWVDPERFPLLYRRMYSTLENPNLFAGYLLMMIGFFGAFGLLGEKKKCRVLLLLFTAVLVLCLLLTYSRGAWVSLAAMAFVLGALYDKRIWCAFLLVPVVLLFYHGQVTERFLSLFSGEDTSTLLRFALWESTELMIEQHPFFGIGWGAYFKAYPDYDFYVGNPTVIIYHAHNMYLSILAEVGIPGGLCYIALIFGHLLHAVRLYKIGADGFARGMGLGAALAVSGMLIYGMGDYVLFSRAVSFTFWGLAAATEGSLLRKERTISG